MKPQHKATLLVTGRQVDIHAPPFVPISQLDSWLSETLKSEGVTLISKSWAALDPTDIDGLTPPEAA